RLSFTGRLSPDAVRDLALFCTLENVEELDLTLGNPAEHGNPVGAIINDLLQAFMRALTIPTAPAIPWPQFAPAVEALSAAPWVRRLRKLRIESGVPRGLLALIGQQLYGSTESGANLIPDAAVCALADALDRDKLETLVLPASVVGPSVREELTT